MRLEEIMSTDVETIKASASADAAWEQMKAKRIRHLVVTGPDGVAGVVSERDLGGRSGAAARKGKSVGELMTEQAVTAKPGDTVRQAANLMRGRGIGCLPIVDRGKLKGIITVTDLLELIGRGWEKPVARTERAMLSQRKKKDARKPVASARGRR